MVAALAFVAFAPLGCDLEVVDPDIITPDNLAGSGALPTIRLAALGDFTLAYTGSGADGSGGTEGQVMTSGLLADEWINSETFPTRIEVDRRAITLTNGTTLNWFRTLSRARASTEFAARRFAAAAAAGTPGSATQHAEVLSLAGFTYLFFAEHYCSGVPISVVNDDGSFTFGAPQTTTELLNAAVARFDEALQVLPGYDLAELGRGRALLNLGNFSGAAAAVAGVPTSFVYTIFHSENSQRQNNGVYFANVIAERYSVAESEGTNGLPYRSAGDPRVPSIRTPATDVGFDGSTPQFDQLRYTSRSASIPLATGAEARLIEAEAFLRLPDLVNFEATHNALRISPPSYFGVTIPPLAPISTAGLTTAQIEDLHFRERGFWLWLTAHRLGDLRRLARQYGRNPESVFPSGLYFKGGLYGTDVNYPVPFDETNNPNFTQCIDRNP
jgi:hypothetical protein